MEVVKLIAWFWNDVEIRDHLKKISGKVITKQAINLYSHSEKWKPIIEKHREDYNKAMYEVPLFHKRKRLDELQKHYETHMKKGDLICAQSVLRDAKDEVDQKFGDISFNFTQITNNQYTEMTDEEIATEKSKILEQMERAQRMKRLLTKEEDHA